MEEYKYLFSVIVTMYNTEKYLVESVESLVNQTIGFENIQLILINNGCTDNSEAICLKYKNKYPDNVVYQKKEHGSIVTGRNAGFKYIEGKYVTFFGSDDLFLFDAFQKVYDCFEDDNHKGINVVRGGMGLVEGDEPVSKEQIKTIKASCTLDGEAEIVDIRRNYFNYKNLGVCQGLFIKKNIIMRYRFDEACIYEGDDKRFFITVLLNESLSVNLNKLITIVRISRKGSMSLATKTYECRKFAINHAIELTLTYSIDLSLFIYGEVLDSIKYFTLYMLQVYIIHYKTIDIYREKYLNDMEYVLNFIPDSFILDPVNHFQNINELSILNRSILFNLKYRNRIDKINIKECAFFIIDETIINENILIINGYVRKFMIFKINKIYFQIDGNYILLNISKINKLFTLRNLNIDFVEQYDFFINLEYDKCKNKDIQIYLDIEGELKQLPNVININ